MFEDLKAKVEKHESDREVLKRLCIGFLDLKSEQVLSLFLSLYYYASSSSIFDSSSHLLLWFFSYVLWLNIMDFVWIFDYFCWIWLIWHGSFEKLKIVATVLMSSLQWNYLIYLIFMALFSNMGLSKSSKKDV